MQPSTLRAIAQHLAKRRRRNWNDHGTNSGGSINTATKIDTPGNERNRSGDGGRNKNTSG